MSSALKLNDDWGYWEDQTTGDSLVSADDDWTLQKEPVNPYVDRRPRIRVVVRQPKTSVARELSPADVRQRFERNRMLWQMKSQNMSSLTDMVLLDEYQQIVGLGPAVVPIIIDSLKFELDHWFPALRSIVGADHAAGAETLQEAAEKWIEWFESTAGG